VGEGGVSTSSNPPLPLFCSRLQLSKLSSRETKKTIFVFVFPSCLSVLVCRELLGIVHGVHLFVHCLISPWYSDLYDQELAQSVWHWATGWTMGVLGFDSRRELGIFLFTTASRTALGPTQTSIQWVPGALSLGVKRAGREADHSPPCSIEVKE
jgi:hypothetical protein